MLIPIVCFESNSCFDSVSFVVVEMLLLLFQASCIVFVVWMLFVVVFFLQLALLCDSERIEEGKEVLRENWRPEMECTIPSSSLYPHQVNICSLSSSSLLLVVLG